MMTDPLSLRIRPATQDDALALATMQHASMHAQYQGIIPDDTFRTVLPPVERWHQVIASTTFPETILVAEGADETIYGFVKVGDARDDAAPFLGEVHALHVLGSTPEYHGIAEALLRAALSHLDEAFLLPAAITLLATSPLRTVCEALGGMVRSHETVSLQGALHSTVTYHFGSRGRSAS